ncbi:hypothetical protein W824_07390 [Clavibacter cf. michiganensis LMG 26808]|nr:hypothetical protein W824_07390 [Clavibacter cf. michiganensis LMG 26808]
MTAAVAPQTRPNASIRPSSPVSTTTPAAATSAHAASSRRREASSAIDSGPRNSMVAAMPRPSRSTAA